MNCYIYSAPPPPPNQTSSGRKPSVLGDQRAHPYKREPVKDSKDRRPKDSNDGDKSMVSPQVLEAARDVEKWIEERRKNWPGRNSANPEPEKSKSLACHSETEKSTEATVSSSTGTSTVNLSPSLLTTKPCNFFLKGNCRWGKKCKFSHDPDTTKNAQPVCYKRFEPPSNKSLFKLLVQNDFDKENEKVLDFILYLYQKQVSA